MSKIPVYAWYFPNWHPGDPLNERWHGHGWSEWQGVKYAAKRFDDHVIYHPLWGYEDESDPAVMGRKIDTALEYGVDGFMWDFYWFEQEGGYRLKALEAFFKAMETRRNFKIALMWCNHDPIYVHPAPYRNAARSLLPGELSPQGFYNGSEYIIHECMTRDCYLTINHEGQEKLYFILWHLPKFIAGMGGVQGARMALDDFRARVRKALGRELYLATVNFDHTTPENDTALLRSLGIDGCACYGWPNRPRTEAKWPAYPYSEFVDNGIEGFEQVTASVNLPMNITVAQGWDSSPRTVPSDMYDDVGYPFSWITDKKNVADFRRALIAARDFYLSGRFTGDFITLTTWNEWTEGNFMEPSVEDGYAYLEAVRDVFGAK